MNLWQKILYWDRKFDHAVKKKIANILTLVFSASIVCGILVSATYRSFQMRAIENVNRDLKKMETERMNKLINKLIIRKYN